MRQRGGGHTGPHSITTEKSQVGGGAAALVTVHRLFLSPASQACYLLRHGASCCFYRGHIEGHQLVELDDVAVDHVYDLELLGVKAHRRGRAAVVDDEDVEALVGEAADGARHALVGKDACADHGPDAHVGEEQPQVCARERRVRRLGHDNVVGVRGEFRHDLGVLSILREEQVVEPWLLLRQAPIAAVFLEARNASVDDLSM